MQADKGAGKSTVHCRTGSLEIDLGGRAQGFPVHCRTGSLESNTAVGGVALGVHCRTGSLEI